MTGYLAMRLLLFVPTLILASLLIFGAMRVLPGDPASVILRSEEGGTYVSAQQYQQIRDALGLSDPIHVQYGKWMWSLVNGEFGGTSLSTREPISQIVQRRLPVTAQLTLYIFVVSMVISIPLGIVAAIYQDRWPDYLIRTITISGHAIPNFWVALMVLLALVLFAGWSPPLRYQPLWVDPVSHFQKVIWPVVILAWGYSAFITRMTRAHILETLRQDYVRTARSKGLPEMVVLGRHALRNALIPVVTVAGLYLGALLSGSLILENIFGIPGIGQGIVAGATQRDYPVIQSLTLLTVFFVLAINLLVDVLYAVIDPRISYSG
jgi:peptide/nickel transport system permease protein